MSDYILQSTQNNLDRTAEIESMLNERGACMLGCGVFCVSGIKMPDGTVINCNEEANMRFVREMRNVLDIMEGKAENINTPTKANKVLALTLGKEA